MQCQVLDLGKALREAREKQGVSQRRLAARAGTSQDAISRIERQAEAPTLERFSQLMLALGWRPVIGLEPLAGSVQGDELGVAGALTPSERLREAASWNRVASKVAIVGERARREGLPATRRSEP
jgi:transcriptional regulator with XRE-family HTH domain